MTFPTDNMTTFPTDVIYIFGTFWEKKLQKRKRIPNKGQAYAYVVTCCINSRFTLEVT